MTKLVTVQVPVYPPNTVGYFRDGCGRKVWITSLSDEDISNICDRRKENMIWYKNYLLTSDGW